MIGFVVAAVKSALSLLAENAPATGILECKTVHLKKYQNEGLVSRDNFDVVTTQVDLSALKDGEFCVKAMCMSADPYLRSGVKNKPGSRKIGDKMEGFISGKVVASKNNTWKVGDLFGAALPFSTVQIVDKKTMLIWKLTGHVKEEEISYGVGVLGMPGSTAYGGLIDVLKPNTGETIFVSGAAGAVGSMVGQLAKSLYGCTVIASCGGPKKCELVKTKFKFDEAIDYKTLGNDADKLLAQIKEKSPGGKGIDMYFENVGGIHFEASFRALRAKGRIAVCGGISEYNNYESNLVKFNPLDMIYTFQRIEGFTCLPYLTGQKLNFLRDMSKYVREGKIVVEETHFDGIESWPDAFQALFTGKNIGKVVVRV